MQLSKDDYTMELVNKYANYISHIPFRSTPLDAGTKLSRIQCPSTDSEKAQMSSIPYRQLIGALNYLSLTIRADIAFSVHYLARFMDNPAMIHWSHLLNVLAYLRDNPRAHITYSSTPFRYYPSDASTAHLMNRNQLYVYVDADFASTDVDSRKSVTGYLVYFNGGLISWRSGLQKTVSSSSSEAEYKALHDASKEVIWLTNILKELGYYQNTPAIMFEDNTNTIRLSENSVASSNLKHIDTIYHQIREFVQHGKIAILHIPTVQQLADLLTKPLPPQQHRYLFNLSLTTAFQSSANFVSSISTYY
jgi:hypothetical protein